VQRVAILGSGVMGGGIALSLALAGCDVALWGRRAEGVAEARARVSRDAAFLAEQRLASVEEAERALAEIDFTTDWSRAVAGAHLALDAAAEDLAVKQELLARAEPELAPEALTSSTTSSLSATRIAEGLARPERFVVAHYAQPAQLMMLVEVVPGERTAPDAVEAMCDLLRRTGKLPAVCADIPGFLFNRLQFAVLREFVYLVEQGHVTPETVDLVLKYGYAHRLPAMGPFEHADLAGLDLVSAVAREIWPSLAVSTDPDETLLGRLREEGRLGMKTGRGFYEWADGAAAEFRRGRDREIVRRLHIIREEEP
jgi:3-hydroxybutyryl-CoA dehydrogenase